MRTLALALLAFTLTACSLTIERLYLIECSSEADNATATAEVNCKSEGDSVKP